MDFHLIAATRSLCTARGEQHLYAEKVMARLAYVPSLILRSKQRQ